MNLVQQNFGRTKMNLRRKIRKDFCNISQVEWGTFDKDFNCDFNFKSCLTLKVEVEAPRAHHCFYLSFVWVELEELASP